MANEPLTDRTLSLFLEYAKDAGNWSGTPLIGGNVGGSKEDRGNITQMKKAGLIRTFREDGDGEPCYWIEFLPAGYELASKHGGGILAGG